MKSNDTRHLFESMTRDELRAVAISLNVPRGRNKTNTIANLISAVNDGTAHVKMLCSIEAPRSAILPDGFTAFVKKLRTYKPDQVVVKHPGHR